MPNFFTNSNDRAYFEAIADRETISNETFHARHYSHLNIGLDTCTRVRRVLCEQLLMCNTLPSDNVAAIFDDVDIAEICFELEEEFGVHFLDSEIDELDGTVDSLIRLTQCKLCCATAKTICSDPTPTKQMPAKKQ